MNVRRGKIVTFTFLVISVFSGIGVLKGLLEGFRHFLSFLKMVDSYSKTLDRLIDDIHQWAIIHSD